MLTGMVPFMGRDDIEVSVKIKKCDYNYPEEMEENKEMENAIDWIDSLLELTPTKRFDSDQALEHKWL